MFVLVTFPDLFYRFLLETVTRAAHRVKMKVTQRLPLVFGAAVSPHPSLVLNAVPLRQDPILGW